MSLSPMTKESDIQIACNQLLNYLANTHYFRHFHVPNEGKRSISYHAKMKKMGLKSGCPDIIIEYPQVEFYISNSKTKRVDYQIIKSCGRYNQKH